MSKLVLQQLILYHSDSRSIPDRIVGQVQAHIRTIARGQSRCNVEFGAKISISVTGDGFTFPDRLSFNPYNEGEDLKAMVFPIAGVMGIVLPLFAPIRFIGHE